MHNCMLRVTPPAALLVRFGAGCEDCKCNEEARVGNKYNKWFRTFFFKKLEKTVR